MVVVSCSGKFHAFNLAEQLAQRGMLSQFYTRYAYQRNTWMRHFVSRNDKEDIPIERIQTIVSLAISARLYLTSEYANNHLYDKWVALQLRKKANDYKVFIGWSGMSLQSLRQAKKHNKLTIIERGAAHIRYQDALLREEYSYYDKSFQIDPRVIDKECQEYDEADYIAIPSQFVKKSFIDNGVSEKKLLVNPYGTSQHFKSDQTTKTFGSSKKFTILYLGALTIQKGLIYLFRALNQLPLNKSDYDVWFVGNVADELSEVIDQYKQANWKFWGHVNHYDLPELISKADVGIQSSIQDGFSMVVSQMLALGIPVIVTEHTGAADIIVEGENGFVIPIRSSQAIAEKILYLYHSPTRLHYMQRKATARGSNDTWESYGDRYANDIVSIMTC